MNAAYLPVTAGPGSPGSPGPVLALRGKHQLDNVAGFIKTNMPLVAAAAWATSRRGTWRCS